MQKQKRKKGGGRKFFDKIYSKKQFERKLRDFFYLRRGYSVKAFLAEVKISRQSFYRFLNKYPKTKEFVLMHKKKNEQSFKQHRAILLQWLRDNPDKTIVDYYLQSIEITSTEVVLYS